MEDRKRGESLLTTNLLVGKSAGWVLPEKESRGTGQPLLPSSAKKYAQGGLQQIYWGSQKKKDLERGGENAGSRGV